MRIDCLLYAKSHLPESFYFQGGDKEKKFPITMVFYLVQSQGKKILIDVGCDELPGFVLTEKVCPADAVRQTGIAPEEITDVIITHAHQDHIQGVKYFPNAIVHIQEDEYKRGSRFIPEGFRVETFAETTQVAELQVIKIGGHSKGSCVVRTGKFLFVGDEYYSPENLTNQVPTGCSYNLEKSKWFVEEYAQDESVKLLFHDIDLKIGQIL